MVHSIKDSLHSRQIEFDDSEEGLLLQRIIASKEFERLGNIRQISFSSNAYGQGTHTRKIHSLGVYYLADKILKRIKENHPKTYDPYQALVVRVRALVHDIGHGPKSHSWEGVMEVLGHDIGHEEWGAYILSEDTEIAQILRSYGGPLLEDVKNKFVDDEPVNFWDTIISSQFDADRLDYLQRDFMGAGIGCGVDESYLLSSIGLAYANDDHDVCLTFNAKAEPALLQFLQSRVTLYKAVSFNKHSESSDALLRHIFGEVQKKFREFGPVELGFNENRSIVRVIMAEPNDVNVNDYLMLTDSAFDVFIDDLIHSNDSRMADISRKAPWLRQAKPLHAFSLTEEFPNASKAVFDRAFQIFDEVKLSYGDDVFSDSFYKRKPSYEETGNTYKNIMVSSGGFASDISHRVAVPDDIVVGFIFSESDKLIEDFRSRLRDDPEIKKVCGCGYGIPVGAVPSPQML
jgi:HD superfamily phosphohydrolase